MVFGTPYPLFSGSGGVSGDGEIHLREVGEGARIATAFGSPPAGGEIGDIGATAHTILRLGEAGGHDRI